MPKFCAAVETGNWDWERVREQNKMAENSEILKEKFHVFFRFNVKDQVTKGH
jgi:hypothetical protein